MENNLEGKIVLIYLKDRLNGGVSKKEGRCTGVDEAFIHITDQQGVMYSFPVCNLIQVVTKFG